MEESDTTSFATKWKDPWEPFFCVSSSLLPAFDTRFQQVLACIVFRAFPGFSVDSSLSLSRLTQLLQYGFNRMSQVCEMHLRGFSFRVLTQAFLLHKGFKTPQGMHQNKDKEHSANRLLFRQFKMELSARYPTSGRECYTHRWERDDK
jgi:N-acetyllactosaminide beta-1,3-N-acetylglucosaminyltransferase